MTSFHHFLRSECVSIDAFVDEVGDELSIEDETASTRMIDLISRYPELQGYFDVDVSNLAIVTKLRSWSSLVRVAIIDHLISFDINISLLIDVVEKYRFEAELEELIEIVRALDILGAEKRLSEYEALLYMKLKDMGIWKEKKEMERICGERLPVSFFDHVKKLEIFDSSSKIVGFLGSQRLIEYCLHEHNSNKDEVFISLCRHDHLLVAQWLYDGGDVNIYASKNDAFRYACYYGHLTVAQWLYGIGDFDIHANDEEVFRLACSNGHLFVTQWLYSYGNVDIHAKNDLAFCWACANGHLLVAQWLYDLDGTNIPNNIQDDAFGGACGYGH
jgi:hypothetical protein